MMAGVNPESVLKPFFGLVGTVLRALINLFILGIRLTFQSGQRVQLKAFEFPDSGGGKRRGGGDDPEIRIVRSDE